MMSVFLCARDLPRNTQCEKDLKWYFRTPLEMRRECVDSGDRHVNRGPLDEVCLNFFHFPVRTVGLHSNTDV